MRIGSPGTQICSHSVMLTHKKRVEVICLTPVMQTEIQSLHPYQLKPHRGGRKSMGSCLERFSNRKTQNGLSFFIISVSLFYFSLTFSTLQPHYPSQSVFLPTHQYTSKSDATAISSFGGLHDVWEKLKQKRDERKRPVYCIKTEANIFLQHCQLSLKSVNPVSLRTVNPVIFGVFWFIRS